MIQQTVIWCFVCFQGKVYSYDKVFKPNCTQEQVYNVAAKPIVKGNKLIFYQEHVIVLQDTLTIYYDNVVFIYNRLK